MQQLGKDRSPQTHARYRVLVIDDYEEGCAMLCIALGTLGHEALSASTGTAGLALAKERRPEIALIDIGLPDMDGNDVAAELKRDNPSIFLIGVSGRPAQRIEASAFDVYMYKPFSIDDLQQTVATFSNRR